MIAAWAYISPLLGLALLFFAFASTMTDAQEERRRKRIVALPTTRIVEATGHGVIELKGRVVADPDEKPLVTPFTGRRVVWQRVGVEVLWRSGQGNSWVHRVAHVSARDFFLEDGSGERARIVVGADDDAEIDVDVEHEVVNETRQNQPHPRDVRAYLASVEVDSKDGEGLRFLEGAIAEGDALVVVGPSTRERVVSDGGYRNEVTQLVVSPGKTKETGLFLSRVMEEERLAEARGFRGLAVALLLAGLTVLATGGLCIFRLAIAP